MKKALSLFLVLAMVLGALPAAFAAGSDAETAADELYDLGLFQGVGTDENGAPIYSLEREMTRYEAVTMLVRLLGKTSDAEAGTWDTPFTDLVDWAAAYVGYAYANGLVSGQSVTSFGGEGTVTATQYLTMVLRALGYESGSDFQWDRAWELSDQLGLTQAGQFISASDPITRGEAALISRNALNVKFKDSSLTLLTLIQSGGTAAAALGGYRVDYTQRTSGVPFDCTSVVTRFPSSDGADSLFGRFYYPADFDPAQKYTTVLLAHGGAITSDIYDTYYAPALAAAGYVCFSYDVRGVIGSFGRSSYSTNANGLEATLDVYVADANAALNFIQTQPFVDTDNIYMWGQSMGAVTTQVITADRGDEINGSILLYGSVSDYNIESFTTDSIDMQAKLDAQKDNFAGEALFILGSEDVASYEVTVDNMAYYTNASLVYLSGAGHGFGYMADRATITATESVIDFLQRTNTASTLVPEVPFEDQFHKTPAEASIQPDEATGYPEGYTVNFDGGYSKVIHVPSTDGLDQIYGRIYYPADFDEGQKYPTILMAHGASITSDIYDTYYAPAMAAAGYVCVSYDVRGVEGSFGRSSYSTNNAGKPANDLDTYVADALAMLRYTQELSFVDTDNLFMWGQSMGAITTQIVTSLTPTAFKGTLLLYGALSDSNIDSTFQANTSTYDLHQVLENIQNNYNRKALFVLGADDDVFSYEHTIGDAEKMIVSDGEAPFNGNTHYYDTYTFLYISGANHGFGYAADRATVLTTQTALDYFGSLVS